MKKGPVFSMMEQDPVLLEELTEEQEDFLRAAERLPLASINPNVAAAPQPVDTEGPQVC